MAHTSANFAGTSMPNALKTFEASGKLCSTRFRIGISNDVAMELPFGESAYRLWNLVEPKEPSIFFNWIFGTQERKSDRFS